MEFSTTAMARPDILKRTYDSFHSHLREVNFQKSTLYLNVDPLPAGDDPMDVVKLAGNYFGKVVHRIPKKPNFTAAVKWCWSNVKGPYVFHLEDDWVLRRAVSIDAMIAKMGSEFRDGKIIQVFLRAHRSLNRKKICLSPSLLSGDFVRKLSGILDLTVNPEVQLRGHVVDGYSVNYSKDISIHDIGRGWLSRSKYKHPPRKGGFTRWIKS